MQGREKSCSIAKSRPFHFRFSGKSLGHSALAFHSTSKILCINNCSEIILHALHSTEPYSPFAVHMSDAESLGSSAMEEDEDDLYGDAAPHAHNKQPARQEDDKDGDIASDEDYESDDSVRQPFPCLVTATDS